MTQESGSPSGDEPPAPLPPYGQPPGQPFGPYGVPPPGAHPVPYGQAVHHHNVHGYPPGLQRHPDARPGTVLAAAVVTVVSTGLTLLACLVGVVVLVVARGRLLGEGGTESPETEAIYGIVLLGVLVLAAWCVLAILMAFLVLRRKNWARITLSVFSALTALLSLVTVTAGVTVVSLGASIATIVCLFTGGASDWFHREHLYSPPVPPGV